MEENVRQEEERDVGSTRLGHAKDSVEMVEEVCYREVSHCATTRTVNRGSYLIASVRSGHR